jgi:hypothetical protein
VREDRHRLAVAVDLCVEAHAVGRVDLAHLSPP